MTDLSGPTVVAKSSWLITGSSIESSRIIDCTNFYLRFGHVERKVRNDNLLRRKSGIFRFGSNGSDSSRFGADYVGFGGTSTRGASIASF